MRKMNSVDVFAAMYALIGGHVSLGNKPRRVSENESRPCVKCGTLPRHNNCYCSVQCCVEHTVEKKLVNRARAARY